LFPSKLHLVWGGSWAIQRKVFESSQMREAWQGILSDDLVASRVLAQVKQRIAYEPLCIAPSPLNFDLAMMAEFIRRQFTIGRFYSPMLWRFCLLQSGLRQLLFWGSLIAGVCGVWTGDPGTRQFLLAPVVIYLLDAIRALLRRLASRYFLPDFQSKLAAVWYFDILLTPLSALIGSIGLLCSAFGNRIVWKGIAYEMRPGGQAQRLTHAPSPMMEPAKSSAGEAKRAA
jgi:hypothetical protein